MLFEKQCKMGNERFSFSSRLDVPSDQSLDSTDCATRDEPCERDLGEAGNVAADTSVTEEGYRKAGSKHTMSEAEPFNDVDPSATGESQSPLAKRARGSNVDVSSSTSGVE
uniref:Aldehyde dehydrogenase PuuC n=1 Tax=Anthurium amnicola TaxID=1678845 RepID=A0A1D1YLM7_9ARAE